MRYLTINGLVLKSTNFKDSDKIYSVLTKERGKVSLLGRGVRKISSRRAGNLDTLNLISAKVYDNAKGFYQVEEVKTINSFIDIKKSYDLSRVSYYMAEIVHKTIEEDANSEEILNLLVYSLKKISSNPASTIEITSFFELRFMKLIGYDLNTDFCVKCGNAIKRDLDKYFFDLNRGGFFCDNCKVVGRSVSGSLYRWISAAKKHDFAKLGTVEDNKDLRVLTSSFINSHLESRFKSLELF